MCSSSFPQAGSPRWHRSKECGCPSCPAEPEWSSARVLRSADPRGEPGEPIPDGQLGPVTVPAGDLGVLQPPQLDDASAAPPALTWVTLALVRPHPLEAGAQRWVELFATRGLAAWPLAAPAALERTSVGFIAAVRRTTADGGQRPLSSVEDLETSAGVIRVVGAASEDRPIPILDVGVAGPIPPLVTSVASVRDGATVELALPAPMPAIGEDGTPLTLSFTAFAPLDLVVGPISVGYL